MHLPILSPCAESCYETWDHILHPRSPVPEPKGGGGHGGGHSGGGHVGGTHSSKGSTSSSKGSTSSGNKGSTSSSNKGSTTGSSGSGSSKSSHPVGSRGSSMPVSGTTFGSGKTTSTAYGSGGVKITTIPQGQPFAGRTYGGATRSQIYGTSWYGSGYPGVTGYGVSGRNFPYVYTPVIWVDYGYGPHYLHSSREYGDPQSTNRTGGPEMQAAFSSPSSNSTFRIVSDNSTVTSLIASIAANCTGLFSSNSSTSPVPYGSSTSDPRPEGAIQYYRASSVALTLDGYNNTAALGTNVNATQAPLPANVDTKLLACLNGTIGEAVPLINSAHALPRPEMAGTLGLAFLVLWHILC
ncbi:hypothetical protein BD309DRAFT_952645 [Dichomitus squalens]|nr:hypothetical protein BD309DRAFT_952645 [Dichomitus squalens]